MSTLLDTNILARLAKPDHPQHQDAKDAVQSLLESGERTCVVPQNLYEFWVVATRPVADNGLGLSADRALSELAEIKTIFTLLRDERRVLSVWEQLVHEYDVHGKTAHDARLVAAMHRHGLTRLLTFNSAHFTRFPNIVVLTPEVILQSGG